EGAGDPDDLCEDPVERAHLLRAAHLHDRVLPPGARQAERFGRQVPRDQGAARPRRDPAVPSGVGRCAWRSAALTRVETVNDEPLYAQIRAEISSGRLHPNERLVEVELAERYGTSRAAIRTALVRLEQEGLVVHERNRGARVRFIDQDEAREMYEARAVLEGLVARKAAELVTDAGAARLSAQLA